MSDFYNCSPFDDCDYENCDGCFKCQATENELFEAGEFIQEIWDELSKTGSCDIQNIFSMLDEVACRINWDIKVGSKNIEEFKEIA